MRVKRSAVGEYSRSSQNRQMKQRLASRISGKSNNFGNSIMNKAPLQKSKTQNMESGHELEDSEGNGRPQILIMPNEQSDSNDNIVFSEQHPESSQEQITVKFKSISNYRTRKGSEDIALNSSNPADRDPAQLGKGGIAK